MGTDVLKSYENCSVGALEEELRKAKNQLKGLNDNIRKIIGRDPEQEKERNDWNSDRKRSFNNDSSHSSNRRTNNDEFDNVRIKREFSPTPSKRRAFQVKSNTPPSQTKSVFSRLSGPPLQVEIESRPRIYSRVIRELPTREEIVEAQCVDEQSKARHRRMFGSLLGTLQKFCQEENRLKTKEEKKAQVEKKLEEQALKEREKLRKERQILFVDRKRQQLEVKKIEAKMLLIKEFETWEKSKKDLENFIKTKAKPVIYYRPKKMGSIFEKRLTECQSELSKEIEKKRSQLNKDIAELEDRFQLRDDEMELISQKSELESTNFTQTDLSKSGDSESRDGFEQRSSKNRNNENAEKTSKLRNEEDEGEENESGSEEGEIRFANDRKNVVITVKNNLAESENFYNNNFNDDTAGTDEDKIKMRSVIKIEKEND